MKYTELVLRDYNRMSLNNIDYFSIQPIKPIQLILGTNGSGKSSMVSEMTPLPPNANDFSPTGGKKVSIESQGSVYTLESIFTPKTSHSFLKDGIELNKGGTTSVQRELCKQEFGITPEIHSIITGETKFSSMSAPDRKYWLTKLSDKSYDYAIKVYNKLCEKSRDVTGTLKRSKQRLVTETAKIVSEDEKQNLVDQITDLHKVLEEMMAFRQPNSKTTNELESKASNLEKQIISFSNTVINTHLQNTGKFNFTCFEDIAKEQIKLESNTIVFKQLIDKYFEDHKTLDETAIVLKQKGDNSTEDLVNKAESLEPQIANILFNRKLSLSFDNPTEAKNAVETVYEILTSISAEMPNNKNREFSRANAIVLNEKHIDLKTKQKHFSNELSKFVSQKEHQEKHKDKELTNCPKCSFSWSVGFNQELYDNICLNIESFQNNLDEVTSELVEVELNKEKMNDYINSFKQFQSCVNNWPTLNPLWNYLSSNSILTDEPRSIQSILEKIKYDLTLELDAQYLLDDLNKTKELIKLSKQLGDESLDKILKEQNKLENEISSITQKLTVNQHNLKELLNYKKDIELILDLAAKIDTLSVVFHSTYDEHKTVLRNAAISDMIKSVQIILARKEQLLSEINMQRGIINDIKNQITVLEQEETSYKLLIKQLSPSEGLIAEGMFGFISNFVAKMNSFIKKIWTYELEIVSCSPEEDGSIDLDYKFPLKMKGRKKPVPDISKGSTAMQEIVNLAFKITAMKYLNLGNTPVTLDEFASSFDSAHRVSAVNILKSLIEEQPFTQLFMVSHYENSYGSLVNADICVLSLSNIVVPKGAVINSHVVIK